MPDQPRHSRTVNGYEGFEGISSASLRIAQRDLQRDSSHAKRILRELAITNPEMALAILSEARAAEERTPGGEIECLKGALMVIASQVRQQQTNGLQHLFETSA